MLFSSAIAGELVHAVSFQFTFLWEGCEPADFELVTSD
jgi:hypothetical protein